MNKINISQIPSIKSALAWVFSYNGIYNNYFVNFLLFGYQNLFFCLGRFFLPKDIQLMIAKNPPLSVDLLKAHDNRLTYSFLNVDKFLIIISLFLALYHYVYGYLLVKHKPTFNCDSVFCLVLVLVNSAYVCSLVKTCQKQGTFP